MKILWLIICRWILLLLRERLMTTWEKIIFNLIICQCQRHCYKMPSKLTSGVKNCWTRSKSKKNKKRLGAIKIEKEIAGLNARNCKLRNIKKKQTNMLLKWRIRKILSCWKFSVWNMLVKKTERTWWMSKKETEVDVEEWHLKALLCCDIFS